MARKRKTIKMRKTRKGSFAMAKKRSTRRSGSRSKGFLGADFQGITFAGIGYSILSRVVRSILGTMPQIQSMGNLIFPIAVLFINHRFFGNSYISVLAINELSQSIMREAIPALSMNGEDENFLLAGDSLDAPFSVSGDSLDMPYSVGEDEDELGMDDESELAGEVGMTSPKDFQI